MYFPCIKLNIINSTMPVQTRSQTKANNANAPAPGLLLLADAAAPGLLLLAAAALLDPAPEIKKNTPSAEILNWIEEHGRKNATALYLMTNIDRQFIHHFVRHTHEFIDKLKACEGQENQVAISVAMWEYFSHNISLLYKYGGNPSGYGMVIATIIEKMREQQKQIKNDELSTTDPIWVEKLQTSLVDFKSELDKVARKLASKIAFMSMCKKADPVLYSYLIKIHV